jgi:uncharacterized membrane protein YbhN (UPF0104 family)
MNDAAAVKPSPVLPFHDPSRRRRLIKVGCWILGIALLVVVLNLLGVNVRGWFDDLFDTLGRISAGYIVAGVAFQTVQTTLTALAWYYILRAAYPRDAVPYRQVVAAYAAGIAMNGFLPANIGTFVTLLMFVAIFPGANFAGVLGGMVVQKIFFTVIGALVYVYLFASVSGSFKLELGGPHAHPFLWVAVVLGGGILIAMLVRIFWAKLKGLWENAKQGGAILARRRDYFLKVALPSFGGWLAKLGVIAVFLAGYGIPVTFHTVMSVVGGNSIANTVSVTPGGVGINQAVNTISLTSVTDPATATAYSLGQQLVVTAWNVVFAVGLVVWAFGVTGGRLVVERSYADAKVKVAEQKAERAARREARRAGLRPEPEPQPRTEQPTPGPPGAESP